MSYFSWPVRGTIVGPTTGAGSSTDNAVVRWDGTNGTTIQNSGVLVDDSNNVTGVVALTATGAVTGTRFIVTGSTIPANGMYLSGTNIVSFATNSALAGSISAASAWTLGTAASTAAHTINGDVVTMQASATAGSNFRIRAGDTSTASASSLFFARGNDGTSASVVQAGYYGQFGNTASSRNIGAVEFWNTNATPASSGGLLLLRTATAGGTMTTALTVNSTQAVTVNAGYLSVTNQADPGAVVDGVRFGSVDLSAGNATLSLRTETAVVTESVVSDRTLSVQINGTTYKICLKV